jgi:hypothetical protein
VKVLRSDRQLFPSAAGGRIEAAELLGELEGVFGLGAVGEEAAGLPAQVAPSAWAGQAGRLVFSLDPPML